MDANPAAGCAPSGGPATSSDATPARKIWKRTTNSGGTGPPACPGCDTVGRQDAHLIGGIGGLERDRGAAAAEALKVASSSSISATTMSPVSAASDRRISAISPSRMPASIMLSPRTSRAKCSPAESRSGGMLITWLRVWIASIGVPAAMRPITGTATGRPPSSSESAYGRACQDRPR